VGLRGASRQPRQWRDRLNVTVDPDENKTSAELRAELLQFMIDNGVKLKLPPTIEVKPSRQSVSPVSVPTLPGDTAALGTLSRVTSAPRGRSAAQTSAAHAVSRAETDPERLFDLASGCKHSRRNLVLVASAHSALSPSVAPTPNRCAELQKSGLSA
jgi:hypothetical protein